MTTKKQTSREAWEAVERLGDEDEMDRILALPPEELDRELVEAGVAPKEERYKKSAETIEKLFAWRERQSWRPGAAKRLDDERARFESIARRRASSAKLTRDELLAAIDRARTDPRLKAPATVMFRNKDMNAATDEELRAILDELVALPEAPPEPPDTGAKG